MMEKNKNAQGEQNEGYSCNFCIARKKEFQFIQQQGKLLALSFCD